MIEIERGSGNVYADLNVPDADAMLLKAQLATKIGEIIQARGWSQQQAAKVLGMTQPSPTVSQFGTVPVGHVLCPTYRGQSAKP